MGKSMPSRRPEKAILEAEAAEALALFLAAGGEVKKVDHGATSYPYNVPRRVDTNGRATALKPRKKDDDVGDQE